MQSQKARNHKKWHHTHYNTTHATPRKWEWDKSKKTRLTQQTQAIMKDKDKIKQPQAACNNATTRPPISLTN